MQVGVARQLEVSDRPQVIDQNWPWLVRTGRHSRSHCREPNISSVFSRSAQKRKEKFKTATHELMVRMAFSPRDIWGTPSSQPIYQVSELKEAICLTEDSGYIETHRG